MRLVGVDLLGVGPPPRFLSVWRRLSTNGEAYGGGFLSLAASQSKGVEEEIEGVDDGGVDMLKDIFEFLGVGGLNAPVCLRVDGENADMVLVEARCVTLTESTVTEHVWDTPTVTPIAFGSDASVPLLLLLRRDDNNMFAHPGHCSSGEQLNRHVEDKYYIS